RSGSVLVIFRAQHKRRVRRDRENEPLGAARSDNVVAMRTWTAAASVLVMLVLGCEEEKVETPAAASAEPQAAAPPPPAPVVEEKPEPKKPKKTLADCSDSKEVEFPSPEFEAAVRLKLQKPEGTVTKADLSRLRSLNLAQVKLDELDICFFSQTKNLRELFLGPGQIDDLSPIEGLTKLESLRASMNPVEDVAPIAKLEKLDRLDLGRTQVRDIAPLASLTKLTELMLDNTPLSDVSALGKLEALEIVSLKNTAVKDFSPLTGLKELKTVYVGGTPGDIVPLLPLKSRGVKVIDT